MTASSPLRRVPTELTPHPRPWTRLAYNKASPRFRAWIDRFRHAVGLMPRVNPRLASFEDPRLWLPAPFKACIVVSADVELAWGWRYMRNHHQPLEFALQQASQARSNMPALLDLFDRFQIPVTWAVVGHLFLERCERTSGKAHPDLPRPEHSDSENWRYMSGDWYDSDPCSDVQRDPAWYAPDLIQAILSAGVRHELGCHTFSHIDCSDGHCPPGLMDAELAECQRLARQWGVQLTSFVFPGNLAGNLGSLKGHGFSAVRWHGRYELDVPRQDEHGLWRIPGSLDWQKPEAWPAQAWVAALKRCVDRALETHTILHLWFHPSCATVNVESVFPQVLEYIASHRRDLWVTTMNGLAEWLTAAHKPAVTHP